MRVALGVGGGDELVYQINDGSVVMTRAARRPGEDPFALFDEWASEADAKAYAQL